MNYDRMKSIREDAELTQESLADKLKVSRSTYAGWENGIDSIPLVKLNDFCNYFKISIDYVCGITNYKETRKKNIIIDKVKVGQKLKEIRSRNGDTQKYVSYIINIEQSSYSNYETGKYLILTSSIIEFAKNYGVSVEELIK